MGHVFVEDGSIHFYTLKIYKYRCIFIEGLGMLQLRQKRQRMTRIGFIALLLMVFMGCSIKPQPQSSNSAHLLLKTPMIRMADFVFIKHHFDYTRLHVLSAGRVVLDMRLGDEICLNGPCYERSLFNLRFFGNAHYPMLLDDIVGAKPIYNGKGHVETEGGFTQNLDIDGNDISYQVSKESIRFEDKTQTVKIVIKPQEGER